MKFQQLSLDFPNSPDEVFVLNFQYQVFILCSTGGLPSFFFLLNVQNFFIRFLCHFKTVSGRTIEILPLILPIMFKTEKMTLSEKVNCSRFFFWRFRISTSFSRVANFTRRDFLDLMRLNRIFNKKDRNLSIYPPKNGRNIRTR